MSDIGFVVAADAPCLDGHFPDRPLVPGVVILDHVAELLARHARRRVTAIRRAKFAEPLAPDAWCRVEWRCGASSIRFWCYAQNAEIAAGVVDAVAIEP